MTTTTHRSRRGSQVEQRRESMLSDFTLAPVTPAERRRAALSVCHRCTDAAEARELLDALGLLSDPAIRGVAEGTSHTAA